MMELKIRRFEADDESGVSALWGSVFPADPPRNAPAAVISRKMAMQGELFFVGLIGLRIVGTVMAGYDGWRGWIYHLAVHPDHRRAGYGRHLMHEAESRLRALGCPKINLQVRAENAGVVQFYEALGYAVERRVSLGKPVE